MQVIDDVVARGAQSPGDKSARFSAPPLDGNHIVNVGKSVEHRRHPVFQKDVDLCRGKKSFKCMQRWSRKDSIADRAKPDDQNLVDRFPTPNEKARAVEVHFRRAEFALPGLAAAEKIRLFRVSYSTSLRLIFGFVLYRGFVDKHHRNVVANGINAVTLEALQAATIRFQFNS